MTIKLFPDQEYLVNEALQLTENGKKHENVLVTSPSGSGKTFIITGLILELLKQGFHQTDILVIAPTLEIKQQLDSRIKKGLHKYKHKIDIYGSVKASNIDKIGSNNYKIIIIDEAHHSEAESYKKVVEKWSDAIVYGFTATPIRNDDKELSDTFKHMISGLSIKELIKEGRLADYNYFQPKHEDVIAFSSDYLYVDGTDFAAIEKTNKIRRTLYGNIVESWLKHAKSRRTIAFTSTIEESKILADTFKVYGINAKHVDGSVMPDDERMEIIDDFRHGNIQVLCNQGLISEGFDVPDTSCVILARPTKSVILYLQQCFRAMRKGSDKNQKAIILDHANNISRFGDLKTDRGWSLTMDKVEKALATTGKDKKPSKNKGKKYDVDLNEISEADMIKLADVKNPQFEKDVKKALEIDGIKSYRELVKIQRRYKIKTPSHSNSTWAYMMAVFHNKVKPYVGEQS